MMINQLEGEESMREIRQFCEDHCLHRIRLTGTGRTKEVIVHEINQQIVIKNLATKVQTLERDLKQMQCDVKNLQKERSNNSFERGKVHRRLVNIETEMDSLSKTIAAKGLRHTQMTEDRIASMEMSMKKMRERIEDMIIKSVIKTSKKRANAHYELKEFEEIAKKCTEWPERAKKPSIGSDEVRAGFIITVLILLIGLIGTNWFQLQLQG